MLPMPIRSSYSTSARSQRYLSHSNCRLCSLPLTVSFFPFSAVLSSPSGVVPEYLWRVFNLGQMDFQFAFSQMVDLLHAPAEVYKSTAIRKQIKNQWSRDDPAFVVLLLSLMFFSALAWLVCFGIHSLAYAATILVGALLAQFLGLGLLVSSGLRWYANSSMRVTRLHAIDQQIEWLYAFDIHCNAFFPLFTLLFTLQYFLLPVLLTPAFLSTCLANTLYLAAALVYVYVTFLGYAALPFIERPERLLYPAAALVAVVLLCTLLNINLSYVVINLYFGVSKTAVAAEGGGIGGGGAMVTEPALQQAIVTALHHQKAASGLGGT